MVTRRTRVEQQALNYTRLLDAAEASIVEHGIHQTTLDGVAALAGLTKGAIYANFAGKRALILAVLERRFTRQRARPRPATEAWTDRLDAEFAAELATPQARSFAILFSEIWLYAMRNEDVADVMVGWLREVRAANADDAAGHGPYAVGSPDEVAALMAALDIGIAMQHLLDPQAVPSDLYARGARAILGRKSDRR